MRYQFFILSILMFSMFTLVTPCSNSLSGSWIKDFVRENGKSSYTLILSAPDEVSSSSNLTITTTITIDHMDKYKTFVFYSSIIITVETISGKQIRHNIQFGNYPVGEFPERLYPGSRWGPNNVTFNLSEEDFGIPSGGSEEAEIFVTVNIAEFIYQPFMAEQRPYSNYETFSLDAGSLKIVNEGGIPLSYFPYIIGIVVGTIIFVGLFMRDRLSKRTTV